MLKKSLSIFLLFNASMIFASSRTAVSNAHQAAAAEIVIKWSNPLAPAHLQFRSYIVEDHRHKWSFFMNREDGEKNSKDASENKKNEFCTPQPRLTPSHYPKNSLAYHLFK